MKIQTAIASFVAYAALLTAGPLSRAQNLPEIAVKNVNGTTTLGCPENGGYTLKELNSPDHSKLIFDITCYRKVNDTGQFRFSPVSETKLTITEEGVGVRYSNRFIPEALPLVLRPGSVEIIHDKVRHVGSTTIIEVSGPAATEQPTVPDSEKKSASPTKTKPQPQ